MAIQCDSGVAITDVAIQCGSGVAITDVAIQCGSGEHLLKADPSLRYNVAVAGTPDNPETASFVLLLPSPTAVALVLLLFTVHGGLQGL